MVFGEGTQVYYSCSVTWRNQFFVFGGYNHKRQISKLSGCKLTSVGTLAFDHYYAACSIAGDDVIYLCFNTNNADDYKKCRSAAEPLGNFTEIPLSTYEHRYTRIASSSSKFHVDFLQIVVDKLLIKFSDEILAVGSYSPSNNKTEMFLTEANRWFTLGDFPLDSDSKVNF